MSDTKTQTPAKLVSRTMTKRLLHQTRLFAIFDVGQQVWEVRIKGSRKFPPLEFDGRHQFADLLELSKAVEAHLLKFDIDTLEVTS